MSINLTKGERINLSKEAPSLKQACIGLGWDVNKRGETAFDLDASIIALGSNGKVFSTKHIIYYGNLASPDGYIKHQGDNLTGQGEGDDETIEINLQSLDPGITELLIVVNIYDADKRKQNFGMVNNSFVRIYDKLSKQEILKYQLQESFNQETCTEFGRLYTKDGQWRFHAVGSGYHSTLKDLINRYL